MPRSPANGAYLSVGAGPVQFQPAEFSKIAVIIFLASYLSETRDVLVRGRFVAFQLFNNVVGDALAVDQRDDPFEERPI